MKKKKMKLWVLKAREDLLDEDNPWIPWYDKTFGVVVRAESDIRARELAGGEAGDEKPGVWLDSKYSSCEELLSRETEEIILIDNWAA